MVRTIFGSVAVLAVAVGARGGTDGVAAVGGAFEVVSAPASVRRQAYQSSTAIRVFLERELSAGAVPVNAVVPGVYDAYADFEDQTVTPGGSVRSYFIHFDPAGSGLVRLEGSVTFEGAIVGVIGRSLTMEQTDGWLGAAGTLYPTDRFDRELEYRTRGSYDFFRLEPDGHTIYVRAECSTEVDQIRVITMVPEPGVVGAVGAVVLVIGRGIRGGSRPAGRRATRGVAAIGGGA